MAWEMYNPTADTQLHTDRYSTGVASLVPRSTPSSILQVCNDTNSYTEAVKQVKTGKVCEHSSHKWHTKGTSQLRRYWARFEHSTTSPDSRVQTLGPTLHPPNVIHILNVPIFLWVSYSVACIQLHTITYPTHKQYNIQPPARYWYKELMHCWHHAFQCGTVIASVQCPQLLTFHNGVAQNLHVQHTLPAGVPLGHFIKVGSAAKPHR